jgi:flagellar biosynthetic protein FliP
MGVLAIGLLLLFTGCAPASAGASGSGSPLVNLQVGNQQNGTDLSSGLQIVFLLTILSLAPALLITVTSFTRIIIVLSLVRSALGTAQMPPNQLLIGLALFLTIFVMAPVGQEINAQALEPYQKGTITQQEAFDRGIKPLRAFMLKQTREKDISLFIQLSKSSQPANPDEVPTEALIPAFIISELKTAFQMGFLIFIPFLIIDMVVSSTLLSMGMMMLPPVMISLPFKLLLFIMVDGWYLIVKSLVMSFS